MEQRVDIQLTGESFPRLGFGVTALSSLWKWLALLASVSLGAIPFGFWFKAQQLKIFSENFHQIYPLTYWLESLGVVYLMFLTAFLASNLFLLLFFRFELGFRYLLMDSLGLLSFALVHWGVAPFTSLCLFGLWKVANLFFWQYFGKKLSLRENLFKHLLVLLVIVFSHSAFEGYLSPFAWDNPIHALKKMESHYLVATASRRINSLPNAKKFDFSNYDKSFWGVTPESVGTQANILLPFLGIFSKVPVIDVEAYFRIQLIVFYVWFIIASFSFYLFCLYGLQLSYFVSGLGAVLFIYSNSFFGSVATSSFPYFSSCHLQLPLALLMIRFAVRSKILWMAFLAGVINTLQLYIQIPHPDPVFYSCVFLGGVTIFFTFSDKSLSTLQKISICLLLGLGFLLASALSYLPVFSAVFLKESRIFGHLEPDLGTQSWAEFFRSYLGPILKPFGLFIPAFFLFKLSKYELTQSKKSELRFFAILSIAIFILLVPIHGNCLSVRLAALIGIKTFQFHCIERVLVYLSFSLLLALLILLDGLEKGVGNLEKMTGVWLVFVGVSISAIVFLRYEIFRPFLLAAFILFMILVTFGYWAGALKREQKLLSFTLILATLFTVVWESTLLWHSPKLFENPTNAKPYITLHSLLVKAKAIPEDSEASTAFLRVRYTTFLSDMQDAQFPVAIKEKFESKLKSLVGEQKSDSWQLIEALAPIIDDYYLNYRETKSSYSLVPNYYQNDFTTGFNYSMPSLFANIGSRFQWILSATRFNFHYGNGETFFMREGNEGYDPKYMLGYPSLNALYITVPADYSLAVFPSGFQHGTEVFTDPKLRKLNNISGGEIYTVLDKELGTLKEITQLKILSDSMPKKIRPPFTAVKDERSYGMAYLASSSHYIAPIENLFTEFRPPFSKKDGEKYKHYIEEYDERVAQLTKLENKHAALIETRTKQKIRSNVQPTRATPGNEMHILNIAGNKGVFEVDCKQPPCQLVFNHANVSGWKAFSDNTELPIERANFAFVSAEIPVGKHTAWFEYRPMSLLIGRYITLLCYLYCFCKLLGHFKMPNLKPE